ncbi:MAG: hypothetical protein HZA50_01970 [Planctomycetes bacterium]|nr:hypothetical protein [Planctomycetota bacterium]
MNMDPDDPKLTAYALGELAGQDKAALEKDLPNSEEALRELEDTKMIAGLLSEALAAEPQPALDERRRENIWVRMRKGHWRGDRTMMRMWVMICMVLGVVVITWACIYLYSLSYHLSNPEPAVNPASAPAVSTTNPQPPPATQPVGAPE